MRPAKQAAPKPAPRLAHDPRARARARSPPEPSRRAVVDHERPEARRACGPAPRGAPRPRRARAGSTSTIRRSTATARRLTRSRTRPAIAGRRPDAYAGAMEAATAAHARLEAALAPCAAPGAALAWPPATIAYGLAAEADGDAARRVAPAVPRRLEPAPRGRGACPWSPLLALGARWRRGCALRRCAHGAFAARRARARPRRCASRSAVARDGRRRLVRRLRLGNPRRRNEYLPALPALDFGSALLPRHLRRARAVAAGPRDRPPARAARAAPRARDRRRARDGGADDRRRRARRSRSPTLLARALLDERRARAAALLYVFSPAALLYGATSADALYATLGTRGGAAARWPARARRAGRAASARARARRASSPGRTSRSAPGPRCSPGSATGCAGRCRLAVALRRRAGRLLRRAPLRHRLRPDRRRCEPPATRLPEGIAKPAPVRLLAVRLARSPSPSRSGCRPPGTRLRALGRRRRGRASRCSPCSSIAAVLGLTKAETERIWLFLGPLACRGRRAPLVPPARMPASCSARWPPRPSPPSCCWTRSGERASSSPAAPASSAPTSSTRCWPRASEVRILDNLDPLAHPRRRARPPRPPTPSWSVGDLRDRDDRRARARGGRPRLPPRRDRRQRRVDGQRPQGDRLQRGRHRDAARGGDRPARPDPAASSSPPRWSSTARAPTAAPSTALVAPALRPPEQLRERRLGAALPATAARARAGADHRGRAAAAGQRLRDHQARPGGAGARPRRGLRVRDRRAALPERLRPAPGARQPLHGRRRDLLRAAARRQAPARVRGRRPDPRPRPRLRRRRAPPLAAMDAPGAPGQRDQRLPPAGGSESPSWPRGSRALLGPELEPEITGEFRAGDIRHCFADAALARELLGFEAAGAIDDGLPELPSGWRPEPSPSAATRRWRTCAPAAS